MKAFHLQPAMLSYGNVFYPVGHMVLMFPTEQDAREAERRLVGGGCNGEEILLLSPQCILGELAQTAGDEDTLPSIGTEAATVRHFVELAREGHHGVMIKSPSPSDTEHCMDVLKGLPISFGQKYRRLIIEDLVA